MDFSLSEERKMLQETIARFFENNYNDIKKRTEYLNMNDGFSKKFWKESSNLGVISGLISPRFGGLGGSGEDISIIFELNLYFSGKFRSYYFYTTFLKTLVFTTQISVCSSRGSAGCGTSTNIHHQLQQHHHRQLPDPVSGTYRSAQVSETRSFSRMSFSIVKGS